MWKEVDCNQRNGRIIEYIMIISNNSNTYNMTSTKRYIIVNDLAVGSIYSISVAAVNSIGNGPFVFILTSIVAITSTSVPNATTGYTLDTSSTGTITGLSVLVGILILAQLASGTVIVLLIVYNKRYVDYKCNKQ